MPRITGLALLLFVLLGSASADDKPKLATLDIVGDSVFIDGVWEPDNPTKQNELIPTVIHLECRRHGGKELTGTEAFCAVATAAAPVGGMLHVDLNWLSVTSWTSTEINITDDSPICLRSETILDLQRKTAIGLDVRKPEAKGFMDTCKLIPDRQTYYLRDTVDYYLNHAPVKH